MLEVFCILGRSKAPEILLVKTMIVVHVCLKSFAILNHLAVQGAPNKVLVGSLPSLLLLEAILRSLRIALHAKDVRDHLIKLRIILLAHVPHIGLHLLELLKLLLA